MTLGLARLERKDLGLPNRPRGVGAPQIHTELQLKNIAQKLLCRSEEIITTLV
jgi:hypothetical protein